MANQRVTCINKNPRDNTHESIRRLGGVWTSQNIIDVY
jgi:hypothetical protein